MAFTEFCCRSGGSNLNAGAVDGSSTEPATTSLVTYTGGDWDSGTDVYTAPVGADMTEAQVGRFASLYVDGDTSPTTNNYLVARITAVNSGARTITLSTTARNLLGTEVTTGTGNRSLRIGGAWAGPSGASGFPLNFVTSALVNASSYAPRVNLKNDQTYNITAGITSTASASYNVHGYGTSYGDGGRATIDGGTSGVSYVLMTASSNSAWKDLVFQNNGATGSASAFEGNANVTLVNCVANNVRGSGFRRAGNRMICVGCEAYSCNKSDTAAKGGFEDVQSCAYCVAHDNTRIGFYVANSATATFTHCIADSNTTDGFYAGPNTYLLLTHCDAYNNSGDGVDFASSTVISVMLNCNFVKNGGYGVNAGGGSYTGLKIIGCGFGAGTQANVSGKYPVTAGLPEETFGLSYTSNTTPWNDPANGDFSLPLGSQAINAGANLFIATAASYGPITSYPTIGATERLDPAGGSGVRMVNVRGGADQ